MARDGEVRHVPQVRHVPEIRQVRQVRQSTFVVVIVVVLAVVAGLGLLIREVNAGHHRPEGAAERWLAAVGDTGRRGVSSDARARAQAIGPVTLAAPLLPSTHDPRQSEFADLEVGKARAAGTDTVRVPFRLHQRLASGAGPLQVGTLVLRRAGSSWHVAALDARRPGEKVRSEGGPPPSRAPLALWVGAIGVGIVLALVAHLITRYADLSARRALRAAVSG
ncbi:MAG: hypothetical protein JO265_06160 [Acidimicrobiia bacterium]|nr:hypothetical protein [Acidimicrobiia bacterium]